MDAFPFERARGIATRFAVVAALGALLAACSGGDAPTPTGAPQATFECVGVPSQKCEQILAAARREAAPIVIAGMSIRCIRPPCTVESGEVAIVAILADGSRRESGQGWASAGPAPVEGPQAPEVPPLDVVPTCVGIARDMCIDFATSASQESSIEPGTISLIVVRCRDECTGTSGEGDTVVTLVSGRQIPSSWSYQGAR